jgi:phosphopantothenoylcysteine decarboxylase/phosphopantothenate--cysteine ligase
MATLTIRNLPDAVHTALRVRAAKAGRSMEEEVRVVLAEAVELSRETDDIITRARAARERVQAALRAANGGLLPTGLVDEMIAERRAEAARE